MTEGDSDQVEEDRVEHQSERKQLFVDLKSKFLINRNYYDKIYLFPNFHIEFTIEVTDEPEDGDDWVVDTHVVDLDGADVVEAHQECSVPALTVLQCSVKNIK